MLVTRPVMIIGFPAKRAKRQPATHEVMSVSGIPMRPSDFVLVNPPKAMAPERAAK